MKIHKNQTRASCFLIAISMPSVRIRAEPQWQPFWKGHYSLVNSTSTAGIGLQYIQYMFWEHIFMWWSSAKTPLQKSICILCMFWKHIFMQWSKEREVIPLTFPTSGWLPLASVQNSPTSRAKIWCLHTLTLTMSWYHRSSWYTGWIKWLFPHLGSKIRLVICENLVVKNSFYLSILTETMKELCWGFEINSFYPETRSKHARLSWTPLYIV